MKPIPTLDLQCQGHLLMQGVERPESFEPLWLGDQDMGMSSPPAWQGSPQATGVSSPMCYWPRGSPRLFCLHPCPVYSSAVPEPPEGSRAQGWLLSARPGLPQGPGYPTLAQPMGTAWLQMQSRQD